MNIIKQTIERNTYCGDIVKFPLMLVGEMQVDSVYCFYWPTIKQSVNAVYRAKSQLSNDKFIYEFIGVEIE